MCDIVKHDLRVKSCELQVINWELKILKVRVKNQKYQFNFPSSSSVPPAENHELRLQIGKFKVTSYDFKSRRCEFELMNYV